MVAICVFLVPVVGSVCYLVGLLGLLRCTL